MATENNHDDLTCIEKACDSKRHIPKVDEHKHKEPIFYHDLISLILAGPTWGEFSGVIFGRIFLLLIWWDPFWIATTLLPFSSFPEPNNLTYG